MLIINTNDWMHHCMHSNFLQVVKRLDKPDTYIPDSRSDPRECFIVTEDYVLIYTTHFTQFVCTCTK